MASPTRNRLPFEAPILEMEAGLAELERKRNWITYAIKETKQK